MRKVIPINQEQKARIQLALAQRRNDRGHPMKMTDLAAVLGANYASVTAAIYDTRPGSPKTRELQARIAAFLGMAAGELFGGNGNGDGPQAGTPAPPVPAPPKNESLAAVLARARKVFRQNGLKPWSQA